MLAGRFLGKIPVTSPPPISGYAFGVRLSTLAPDVMWTQSMSSLRTGQRRDAIYLCIPNPSESRSGALYRLHGRMDGWMDG